MRYLWVVLALALGLSQPVAAEPKTVYFYTWGGNPAVNDYLRWAARQLEPQDIRLQQVKVADIGEVVKQLVDGRSNADLLWINGENFHVLKEAQRLRKVTGSIAGIRKLRTDLDWQTDFGEPVAGLEVPWGLGQFHLLSCQRCLPTGDISAAELLLYADTNPGRITYPKPPEFHGTTFLKSLLLSLTEHHERYQQPVSTVDAQQITQSLWNYLDRLHPLLWRQGESFPSSAAEQRQWFANGALDIAVSFNPNDAQRLANQGRVPSGTQRVVLGHGAITNHHYLAIPKTAQAPVAAETVIEFLLSPAAQQRKSRLTGWADPPVIALDSQAQPELLPQASDFHASWQDYLEQTWQQRYQ